MYRGQGDECAAKAVYGGDLRGMRKELASFRVVDTATPLESSNPIMRREECAQGVHTKGTEEAVQQDKEKQSEKHQDGGKRDDAMDRVSVPQEAIKTSLSVKEPPSTWTSSSLS
ncbi:hypothetical protein NDU88_003913 [Pleurodeles waltl]|uniref:Uncharacterized protein n=1 Tax=Pleurodeles waltl TaxID=8319 RepID=A0AAV7RF93_PLEWA|nr:hypothetical protein NDU88_003913 [Pleurodeles waltl]